MRTRILFTLVVATLQLSCGGMETVPEPVPEPIEVQGPDPMGAQSTWPDAPDLGVVVFSEVVPLENPPPPPDFARLEP